MNRLVRCLCICLCCLFLGACAAPVTSVPAAGTADERLLSDLRMQYHNSSLIVQGACTGMHIDKDGNDCYDLVVDTVYAGSASVGDIVHCANSSMDEGENYVLFLGEGESVHYAEDVVGYTLLTDTPLPVVQQEVLFNGKNLALATLEDEIEQLQTVISVPSPAYYYDALDALADAADEIFIGRVVSLPVYEELPFDMRNGGVAEKARYRASIVTVEVLGSIKGALGAYGSKIELVHAPDMAANLLDAATVQPKNVFMSSLPGLEENGIYLFFLKTGPDAKQNYYFTVNPLQGFVAIDRDDLHVNLQNTPMYEYSTLTEAVEALREALRDDADAGGQDEPLLIVEE